jgi:hypothetical protein
MVDTSSNETEDENTESLELESNDNFSEEVNSAKDALLADNEAEISTASPVYEGLISSASLKEAIPSFDVNSTDEVQSYEYE